MVTLLEILKSQIFTILFKNFLGNLWKILGNLWKILGNLKILKSHRRNFFSVSDPLVVPLMLNSIASDTFNSHCTSPVLNAITFGNTIFNVASYITVRQTIGRHVHS